ncbi:hypothetical protein AK812_SmicGene15014 [Symbiodinium microadriaticum]|uniref:Uncharacterized protein n=1 Tax=Symbiodinium microadriaticum TaxID=2951 RepID=A0A1Q9E432_SYMMI|nr:hypothetical protein AK812_SmicGene15014 [Symbiodinium microadriaticum]
MLWSHGWALAKVMMLFVVCNGFPAAVAGTLSPTATLCFSTNLVVCGLAFVFWRSSKKELQIDARLLADATYMRRSDVCGVDHLLQRRV